MSPQMTLNLCSFDHIKVIIFIFLGEASTWNNQYGAYRIEVLLFSTVVKVAGNRHLYRIEYTSFLTTPNSALKIVSNFI